MRRSSFKPAGKVQDAPAQEEKSTSLMHLAVQELEAMDVSVNLPRYSRVAQSWP